jgi:single-strand DNA-binding protein
VYVEGRITNRSYDDKDGNKRYITEIVARDVRFLGGGGQGAGRDAGFTAPPGEDAPPPPDGGDDDIPF